MKSKISFFNKTIFLKNVTLYWPIWVVYTLFLLGGLPVNLWFSMQDRYRIKPLTETQMLMELSEAIQPSYYICVIACAVVIAGMALFSYLYRSQSANMIHSLPVDRRELFGTNVISGLVFLIVPQIFTFVLTILVCLDAGIPQVEYVGMWLLIAMVTAFISFAFVTFCAFFTGQLVALPVYVIILNALAYAVNALVQMIVELFGYGVCAVGLLAEEMLICFAPIVCYLSKVTISYQTDASGRITGLSVDGIACILIYFIIAVVLYVAAYFVYRRRRIESAGDLITVGILKPIFRWGVGSLAGFYITIFFSVLFTQIGFAFSYAGFVIGLLFFGAVFYFVADMFVRKTFRVFKKQNWKGCGIFCIVLLLSLGGVVVYSNVEEKRIPKAEDVDYVGLSMGYYVEYENEDVEKVIDIHEKILENLEEYEELDLSSYDEDVHTQWIYISYCLKDGSTMKRNYRIPYEGEGKEIIDTIEEIEKEPENFLSFLLGSDYEKPQKFGYGQIDMDVCVKTENTDTLRVESISEELTATQSEKLYEAIIADGLAGNLMKYNGYYFGEYEDTTKTELTYCIYLETYISEDKRDDGEYAYNYRNVYFGKDCVNILNAINELELKNLESAEDIYWGEDVLSE